MMLHREAFIVEEAITLTPKPKISENTRMPAFRAG